MSVGRVAGRSLILVLGIAMLGALLPAGTVAAAGGKAREYIVTLDVAGADRLIRPSSRSARKAIERRQARTGSVTTRLASTLGFDARYRFGNGLTGFAASLTSEQVAKLSRDATVVSVRRARKVRLADAQIAPTGIRRVKAAPTGAPSGDVDVDVLVIDTGIGPVNESGDPVPIGPAGAPELNIAGGVNCYDDPSTPALNEAAAHPGRWGDAQYHGTHVAGIIGARDNGVGTVGVAPGARLWAARAWGPGLFTNESNILCAMSWAIGSHSDQRPGIDIINMSFEVPRLDYEEDCGQVLARPDSDPLHKLVCTAHGLGITMVAAAGNKSADANSVAPGGYDQVISVGALVDLDGEGWGKADSGACGYYGPGLDDTYADYSNRGREVDIVAPGECITSTYPTATGDATTALSGTSQAAPHVTGAAARWVATHPGTSPAQMRKLIRASGRLDWNARSDPLWSGPNDADEPHRVLDVAALTGGRMLKTWVSNDGFTIGGGSATRTTRVDVQRGGGYGGPARLSLSGLPGGVGSASFGKVNLTGLNGLGTSMRLQLKRGGGDGVFDLGVTASGAGVAPFSRTLRLTVDRKGPKVSGLKVRLRAGLATLTAKGAAQAYVKWKASDAVSGVRSAWLERRNAGKPWRRAGVSGKSSARVVLKPGQTSRFRVKASDRGGTTSTSKVLSSRLVVRDATAGQMVEPASGGWKSRNARQAYGGSIMQATGPTDSLSTDFRGKAVAVVGAVGPQRGQLRVRVDGGEWSTVSLQAPKPGYRKVVWSRQLKGGSHRLEIQGLSGKAALDAVLFVR